MLDSNDDFVSVFPKAKLLDIFAINLYQNLFLGRHAGHTCDVKASPQFSDVEVTWQNGSWPLVGNVTCKEEGSTWKAISASHAMCFADIWSLSGECEEQTIQNPTVVGCLWNLY